MGLGMRVLLSVKLIGISVLLPLVASAEPAIKGVPAEKVSAALAGVKKDAKPMDLYNAVKPFLYKQAAKDLRTFVRRHPNVKPPQMKLEDGVIHFTDGMNKATLKFERKEGDAFLVLNDQPIKLRDVSDYEDLAYRMEKILKAKGGKVSGVLPMLIVGEQAEAFNWTPMLMGGLLGGGIFGALTSWDANSMILGGLLGGLVGWFGDQQGWWDKQRPRHYHHSHGNQ